MSKYKVPRKLIYILAFFFSIIYLVWRGVYTLPFGGSLFALIFGILLWFSEIISNFTAVILIWSKNKAKQIEKPEIAATEYPHVDVLIATHNEEVPLLLKTVNAAVNMHYPDKRKVHIYFSDDTNRPEVKELAEKFDVGYLGLENNQHAKSGNLNNALAHTTSPLVATFDADMIPYSDFLMETVPYFVGNAKERAEDDRIKPIGLVQTPQSFYNADLFQFNLFSEASIPNEQDFFSREVNILNNAHDAAIYTGSNTVIAREAIEAVGGFPTDTITEDFELGALINTKGYKNISTLEPMASGLTPTDIPSVLKQRIRWGRGVVQSVRNLHILTNKNLTLQQKLVYLNGFLYWWSFFRRLLYILAPILFTVFGVMVVDTNFWNLLLFWLPSYYFLHLAMQDLSSDIRTQRWGEVQETIFAPFLILPIFLQTIGIKETKFKVTNKNAKQSKRDYLYVLPHLILWVLTVVGLVSFNYGKYGSEIFYGAVITFWLLTHLFNLTFSVLFYLGRPIYRKNERFLAENQVTVSYQNQSYELKTKNISEDGLSFVSTAPLYFPEDALLNFSIKKGDYQTELTGKIVRVYREEEDWIYGVALSEMTEAVYLVYLQIIYDGFNRSLPQFRDPWVTPFDLFFANLKERLQHFGKKRPTASAQPTIPLNQVIQLTNFDVLLRDFDYQTVSFAAAENLKELQNIQLQIDEVPFDLEFLGQTDHGDYRYRVANLSDIIQTASFKKLIHKWVEKGDESDTNSFAY
ncbi:glycosyltransferase [Enterococcus sp. LJL120]